MNKFQTDLYEGRYFILAASVFLSLILLLTPLRILSALILFALGLVWFAMDWNRRAVHRRAVKLREVNQALWEDFVLTKSIDRPHHVRRQSPHHVFNQ